MARKLCFNDGYFNHHITVYGQAYTDNATGKSGFLPIIHRSGQTPVIAGVNKSKYGASAYLPMDGSKGTWLPLPEGAKVFNTAFEAEAYASKVAHETDGKWCKDYYYNP